MINSKIEHCTSLEEFYSEIRRQQEEAHGEGYCAHHDAIQKYLKECTSYKELGTHQGASAAAACLSNPNVVELVDIDFTKFRVSEHLFTNYCNTHEIDLVLKELSSIDKNTASFRDLLLIDSVHKSSYLIQELMLHGPFTQKFIILHDTHILLGKEDPSLFNTAQQYANTTKNWEIIEHYPFNAGYTVLARK